MLSFIIPLFLGCGSKNSDTSSPETAIIEASSEDTSSPEASSEDTGTVENPDDTGDQDSGDTSDQIPREDTGTNDINNSEAPPTGSCSSNSVIANIDSVYGAEGSEQLLSSFYWTTTSDENGLKVIFAGYKASADVDVCNTLSAGDYPPYPQVVVTARPTLSELPQQLSVGLWDIDTNAGAQTFFGDPELQRIFWVTEGSVTINSIIENEKALLSELQLAQLGEDINGAGDWENLETTEGYVQASEGTSITACYCAGLTEIYP